MPRFPIHSNAIALGIFLALGSFGVSAAPSPLVGLGRYLVPGQTAARISAKGSRGTSVLYRRNDRQGYHRVVLSPAWMARRYWRISDAGTPLDTWLSVAKAPNGGGSLLFSDGLLNVKQPEWVPAGTVKPRFLEGWNANVTYRLHMAAIPTKPALRGSIGFSDNLRWGYELGGESDYLSVSFFDELPYPGATNADGYHYLDKLVQAEAKVPLRFVTPYIGLKSHWKEKDLWLRTGFRFPTSQNTSLDLGTDIFAGPPGSYFGGWTESDRAYTVVTWKL